MIPLRSILFLIGLFILELQIVQAQWERVLPLSDRVRAFAVSGPNILAGTDYHVFLSTDNGTNWSQDTTIRSGWSFANSGLNLFVASGNIFLSTDNGSSWKLTSGQPGGVLATVWSLAAGSIGTGDTNIYAGTRPGGFYRSTNNGTNWAWAGDGLPQDIGVIFSPTSLIILGESIFGGGEGNGVWCFTDNDPVWRYVGNNNTGLTCLGVFGFANIGTDLFIATCSGVFVSTNDGIAWRSVSIGLPNQPILAITAFGSNLFAGSGLGVFLSTNYGESWTPVNTDLVIDEVRSLAIGPTSTYGGRYLFAGTYGSGIWRRSISELTDVENVHSIVPSQYLLEQNYPNPFNPSTTIKFNIPHTSTVILKIYDLLGREIAVLLDEEMKPGSYEKRFDGSGLANAVYLYRLSAGSFTQTRKLQLLK